MSISIIYAIIIFFSCVLGAIVGLGGGVFIRPAFDALGYHNVLNIGFFASSAILVMSIVSTVKKIKDGTKINAKIALMVSLGAVAGGVIGNIILEQLVATMPSEASVQYTQIIATLIVLAIAIFLTTKDHLRYELNHQWLLVGFGVILGMIASFLGIGGGAINVPIFMIFFGLGIKDATAYSIVVVFFSHLARLLTLGVTVGYMYFDLSTLPFVIVAAGLGGFFGAKLSGIFSAKVVKRLFQGALGLVMVMNIINGLFLI